MSDQVDQMIYMEGGLLRTTTGNIQRIIPSHCPQVTGAILNIGMMLHVVKKQTVEYKLLLKEICQEAVAHIEQRISEPLMTDLFIKTKGDMIRR